MAANNTSTEKAKTQHTPGPWYPLGSDVMPDREGLAMTQTIARCVRRRGHKDEAEANARLIAAAPDLLEALEAFVKAEESFLSSVMPGTIDDHLTDAYKQAKAAIEKARNGC